MCIYVFRKYQWLGYSYAQVWVADNIMMMMRDKKLATVLDFATVIP